MTTTQILKIVDPSKEFVVCTNAVKEGLGGILSREGNVICCESWKLKEHEKKYVVHDMELASTIHALKNWQDYLTWKNFLLLTENIGLKYLFYKKKLNAHQARLLSFLSEYDFEIKYIKGKENIVEHALSR